MTLNKEQVIERLSRSQDGKVPYLWELTIGDIDLSGHVFEHPVNFSGACFAGTVNFTGAIFKHQAVFDSVTFHKKANFSCCEFQSNVYFWIVKFHEEACFFKSRFLGQVKFWEVRFYKKSNFSQISVFPKRGKEPDDGEANFSWTWFLDEAIFQLARFHGPVIFWRTLFMTDVYLDECEFEDKVIFEGQRTKVHFSRNSLDEKTINELFSQEIFLYEEMDDPGRFVSFNENLISASDLESRLDLIDQRYISEKEKKLLISAWIEGARHMFPLEGLVSFRSTTFKREDETKFSSVNLNSAYLQGSNISSVKLTNIKWDIQKFNDGLSGFRRAIRDERNARNKASYDEIAEIYSSLSDNYSSKGSHAEAIDFYYGHMEMKRNKGTLIQRTFSLLSLYKYLSGYGTRYTLAILWLLVLVCVIFPAIYLMDNYVPGQMVLNQIKNSIFRSIEIVTLRSEVRGLSYAIQYIEWLERILVGGIVILVLKSIRCRIWGVK